MAMEEKLKKVEARMIEARDKYRENRTETNREAWFILSLGVAGIRAKIREESERK